MKTLAYYLSILFTFFVAEKVTSQNTGISDIAHIPDSSAVLDIYSTSKGILIPRMSEAQRLAIANPSSGLLTYQINGIPGFYYYNGTTWTIINTTSQWDANGNDIYYANGGVCIGTATLNSTNPEKLLIDAGNTSSVNAIVAKGSIDSYLQLNIQNKSAGTNASSDIVATANNGSETSNFVDLGINGGSYNAGIMGASNDAYLYNIGQNFLIGAGSASKSLVLMTGGTNQTLNERMRIDGNGKVGIGTSTPLYLLDVNGAVRIGKPNATNGSLLFSNASNTNTVTINSGVTSSSYTLTLPSNQAIGSSVLTNNGSGILSWAAPNSVSAAWTTNGNGGTNSATNFIGTTDNQALVVKVNNNSVERFETNAIALGLGATTNNSANAYAIGSGATVGYNHPGTYVIGNNATANSENSLAIGNSAAVNAANSIAIGNNAASNSLNSVALGLGAIVGYSITDGIALGENATTSANNGIAIGSNNNISNKTQSNGTNALAIGVSATSNSTNGIAIGTNSNVAYSITEGIAIGTNAMANSNNAIAIGGNISAGSKTQASAPNAISLGVAALTGSTNSIAIGTGATVGASLSAPLAIGNASIVNGNDGVGIGNGATISYVTNATAIGSGTNVTGNNSTAIGDGANVSGSNSTAIGFNTSVTQNNALILGDVTNSALSVGIGSQTFNTTGNREKLLVDAGTTSSVNAIVGKGNINNYLQLNIQNLSNGASASSDVVATANNGSETSNFVDMGINGGSYSAGVMGAANDAYLYNVGQNFLIGTGAVSKSLIFMTGGTAQATNERMRIDGSGNVGIGSIAPGNKLEVNSGTGGVSGLRLKQLPTGGVLFMNATADVTQNNNNFYFDAVNYRLGIANGTAPNSTLSVGGSLSTAITTKTANYSVTSSDYTIICNNTSGSITIGLPAVSGCAGRIYVIKKISASANNVVIDASGTEKIDGIATKTLTNQYESVMIQSDGTNWFVLSKN